jgi:cellobiose phosphorylase
MAFAALNETNTAWDLFSLINPVRHADTPAAVVRYKVEPYVVAADIYSLSPHTGRGGWSWYTGSAGWFYRLITESLIGLRLEVDRLHFTPCLPSEWKFLKLHYRYRETTYHISLFNEGGSWSGGRRVSLDGIQLADDSIPLKDDHLQHIVEVHISGNKNVGAVDRQSSRSHNPALL